MTGIWVLRINHELGHAYLYASGDDQKDTFNAELDVAELMQVWGFDDDDLQAFLDSRNVRA